MFESIRYHWLTFLGRYRDIVVQGQDIKQSCLQAPIGEKVESMKLLCIRANDLLYELQRGEEDPHRKKLIHCLSCAKAFGRAAASSVTIITQLTMTLTMSSITFTTVAMCVCSLRHECFKRATAPMIRDILKIMPKVQECLTDYGNALDDWRVEQLQGKVLLGAPHVDHLGPRYTKRLCVVTFRCVRW